jgi:hypothetical protein
VASEEAGGEVRRRDAAARGNRRKGMKSDVTITLILSREAAAGLLRFADKVSYEQAASVLYPHVRSDVRCDQAHAILSGFSQLQTALDEAGVKSWPWIETGQP